MWPRGADARSSRCATSSTAEQTEGTGDHVVTWRISPPWRPQPGALEDAMALHLLCVSPECLCQKCDLAGRIEVNTVCSRCP